jgi:phosphotransferase system enzyme I (PtsP)
MVVTASTTKPVVLFLKKDEKKISLKRNKKLNQQAEIICASDPSSGLEVLSRQDVAVLICDPQMDKMDGIEFISRVRKLSPDTFRVLLNCAAEPGFMVKAINKGKVWKCLTSPWKVEEIEEVVQEGIELWNRKQEAEKRPVINRPDFYLQLVKQITDLLNQSENVNFLLKETVNLIRSSLHYDVVSIYLWDDQAEELVLRSNIGLSIDPRKPVKLKPDEGLTGYVFSTRRSCIVMPASKHKHYKYIPAIGEKKFESYIGVPIILGQRTLGVLVAQIREQELISPAEETLFQLISSRLAGLLDVANRVEKLKKPKKKKHAARVYQGKGVSPGYATGSVYLLQGLFKEVSFDHLEPTPVKNEISRLMQSFKTVEKEQKKLIEHLKEEGELSKSEIKIFKSHLMIVQDAELLNSICQKITQKKTTAETAVVEEFENIAGQFENQQNRYFQERAQDFRDIGENVLQYLLTSRGEWKESRRSLEGAVIVARDISPSMLPTLNNEKVAAIVTETGGATSHTAILARSLGIPAVVGVENVCKMVVRGEQLLVDGRTGLVFLNPEKSLLQEYAKNYKKQARYRKILEKQGQVSSESGMQVKLTANIGFPVDMEFAVKYKIGDVGLFRTEFPFMQYEKWPTVAQQAAIYEDAAKKFTGHITIRTLDIGADKLLPYFKFPHEENPMLGLRSIRFSMEYLDFFKDQIKAILMVINRGYQFRILLPMVSRIWELETASKIIKQTGLELDMPQDRLPELGIMTEVPGVLHQLIDFKQYINFISIGTNDLIQYILAVDRNSSIVGHLYSAFHPAVIRTMHEIIQKGKSYDLEVSICGETAGTPIGALALISLGCRQLSILPARTPIIRFLINKLTPQLCEKIKDRILSETRQKDIESFLNEELETLEPKLLETELSS